MPTPGGRPGRRPEAPKPPAPPSLNLDLAAANSAADIARQAAVAAHIGAAVAALSALLISTGVGDGNERARLLLEELAAALRAEPLRQAQHEDGAGQAKRTRSRRRRDQRARAMRTRFGVLAAVRTSGGGEGGEQKRQKDASLVFWQGAANFAALGERRAAVVTVFEAKSSGAGRDEGARTGVAPGGAESAGVPPLAQQRKLVTQPAVQAAALAAAPPPTEMAQMEA